MEESVKLKNPNKRIEIDKDKLIMYLYNKGWDYTAFANECGIDYTTFHRIINGRVKKPKSLTMVKMCGVLGIDDVRDLAKVNTVIMFDRLVNFNASTITLQDILNLEDPELNIRFDKLKKRKLCSTTSLAS